MSGLGYHIRFKLRDDRVIAPTMRGRRILARTVLEHGRAYNLYAFGYPDTHVHLAARVDRGDAGRLTHAIEASLRQRLGLTIGFVQYEPKLLSDQHHLTSTVRYILAQADRHGVTSDPRREGSNLPDLLGLRLLGRYTRDNLERWLPRLGLPDFLEPLGVTVLAPARAPVEDIIPATLAAGCRADLVGSSREVVALRRAAAEILADHLRTTAAAAMLGISPRGLQRLRERPIDTSLVRAIELQLGLELPLCRSVD